MFQNINENTIDLDSKNENKKSTNKAYQIRETKGVTDHECSHYRWERKNGKKI